MTPEELLSIQPDVMAKLIIHKRERLLETIPDKMELAEQEKIKAEQAAKKSKLLKENLSQKISNLNGELNEQREQLIEILQGGIDSLTNDYGELSKILLASDVSINEFEKFDVILNLEIIEHVENVNLYIESCYKLLKKNGIMFTATLNRTLTSYLKAIIGAEYILRWLPIGTHDWNKFIKPEELDKNLFQKGFETIDVKGLEFNPFLNKWKKSNNLSVNYIIFSKKS